MMTKIGIMSFAHMHAFSYAACVNAHAEAELTAIWDDDPKRGRKMAKQNGTKFIADQQKFLNSGLDGVIICSENAKHRRMVEAAAKAGLWILCEKPLATTVADAKAMIAACKKAGVGLGTAFPCRYITPLIEARDAIQRGDYGTLRAATCTNNGSFPGGWFAEKKLSGGGATMDHTVHVADVLRWITGHEFKKVFCENGRLIQQDTKVDDFGSLHLEMDDGLQVSHVASWNRCASFPTWGDVTIEFVGDKGVLYVDAFRQKVDVYNDAARKGEWVGWGDNADQGLVDDFIASILYRREPSISGEDGLRAVEVTVAAEKSAATGKMVSV